MTVTQEGLTFGDGGVRLTCPWAVGVGGEILVDGERVQGEWTPDATDSWVCRVGGWQLVMQQPAPGLLALRLVNVSAERISLGGVRTSSIHVCPRQSFANSSTVAASSISRPA